MAALLVLLTLAAYWPAFRAGFIWDDEVMLTQQPLVKAADGLYYIWFSTLLPDYYPMTSTSFWLEWRLWGLNASGYHVTNVLLHCLSAILLWRALKSLAIPGAWLAAAWFAVHPVNVASVAWIAERKNVLAMVFYALAFLFYQRCERSADAARTGQRSAPTDFFAHREYWAALFAFLLALLSKTAGVMLPVVLLLCAWWRRGKITRRDCWNAAPFFGLAAALALVTIWFQYNRAIGQEIIERGGFAERLATAGCAVWFYLSKALLPVNLAAVYPRWEINAHAPLAYLPLMALVVALAVCWRYRLGWGRACLFGLGVFVLMLFPVLGFFKIYYQRYSLVADHWQYFSIIGVLALAVGSGMWLLKATGLVARRGAIVGGILAALLLGAGCVLTWREAGFYKSSETLWRHTLAQNPASAVAHHLLGIDLKNRGLVAEAAEHIREAYRLKPDDSEYLSRMAALLSEQGERQRAVELCREAVRLNPGVAELYCNLGRALAGDGQPAAAIAAYQTAIKLNPQRGDFYYHYGNGLLRLGNVDEAVGQFRQALKQQPDHVEAYYQLAFVLAGQANYDEAIQNFTQLLRFDPGHALAQNGLGLALALNGQSGEAISHYQEALRLNPELADAHNNLGQALLEQHRPVEAASHFQEALRLSPQFSQARYNYGLALVQLGRRTQAIEAFREVLRLLPGDQDTRKQLQALGAPLAE